MKHGSYNVCILNVSQFTMNIYVHIYYILLERVLESEGNEIRSILLLKELGNRDTVNTYEDVVIL